MNAGRGSGVSTDIEWTWITLNASPIEGSGLGMCVRWYTDVNQTVGLRLWYQSDEGIKWLAWDTKGNNTNGTLIFPPSQIHL